MTSPLAELRALLESATPGPWYASSEPRKGGRLFRDDDKSYDADVYTIARTRNGTGWNTDGGYPGYGLREYDARLIVAAVNALPALLAVAERAQKVVFLRRNIADRAEMHEAITEMAAALLSLTPAADGGADHG